MLVWVHVVGPVWWVPHIGGSTNVVFFLIVCQKFSYNVLCNVCHKVDVRGFMQSLT